MMMMMMLLLLLLMMMMILYPQQPFCRGGRAKTGYVWHQRDAGTADFFARTFPTKNFLGLSSWGSPYFQELHPYQFLY